MNTLQKIREKYRVALEEKQAETVVLENQIKDLKSEVDFMKKDSVSSKNKIISYENNIDKISSEKSNVKVLLADRDKQIIESKDKIDGLIEDNAKLLGERDILKSSLFKEFKDTIKIFLQSNLSGLKEAPHICFEDSYKSGTFSESAKKEAKPTIFNHGHIDEDKEYKYVIHSHFIGKSVHQDLRYEIDDQVVGWEFASYAGKVLERDIKTLFEAKEQTEVSKVWKDNNINVIPKMNIPKIWLGYEGITKHGVVYVMDSGIIEVGAQKDNSYEYFLDGKKYGGKWFVRQLPKTWKGVPIEKSDIFEYGDDALEEISEQFFEENNKDSTAGVWIMSKATDQTPYVLSKRAYSRKWTPTFEHSAIPRRLREQIPSQYRFWEEKSILRKVKIRDDLFNAIKKKEVILE